MEDGLGRLFQTDGTDKFTNGINIEKVRKPRGTAFESVGRPASMSGILFGTGSP